MEQTQQPEQDKLELEEKTKQVWKTFGRESDVGKILFSLYKTGKPAQINYPKPKTKPFNPNVPKEIKPCPQKQVIDYPEPEAVEYKVDKFSLIPKRKPQAEIQKEIDKYYEQPYIPLNRGKDRQQMISQLQQKFKYSTGVLPEKVSMPLDSEEIQKIINDPNIKEMAKQKFKSKNYLEYQKQESQRESDENQLNLLFQQILEEIEERQQFLGNQQKQEEKIKDLKEPELKKRIKQEIVERVSELQKVTELQQKIIKK